jgi:hypothetical protein
MSEYAHMQTQLEPSLSYDELDLMERRSRAASPGPWTSFVVGRDLEAGLNCIEVGCCALIEVLGGTVADQDFIASAREDVPRLVGEVRRLRAQLDLLSGMLREAVGEPGSHIDLKVICGAPAPQITC